jgi:phospholipase/lecithinase/hemolysin
LQGLYTLGARKFALTNVGLAGCLPAARLLDAAGSCSDLQNYLAYRFDSALRSLLDDLTATQPGFVYSLADFYDLMTDTFNDDDASGFTDVASACCGGGRLGAEALCSPNSTICVDRDEHYFWDNVHITQQAAKQRADAFYDGPAEYTTPINYKQLMLN